MRRWTKISFTLFTFLASFSALATVSGKKEQFKMIYQTVVDKMHSTSSVEEKLKFLDSKNKEYVLEVRTMSKSDNTVIDSTDYAFAWDLYDEFIPLLNLKMDSTKQSLSRKSCLEAMSLVTTKTRQEPLDEELPALSAQSQYTLQLIEELCKSSLRP